MIDPVSRVESYTGVSSVGTKTSGNGNSAPFSMDQALAEESAKGEGVYYEHSSPRKSEKQQSKASSNEKENSEIVEKPNPEAPLGAIDTANLLKSIGKYLSGIWENVLRIFGNIWESKPLNEGMEKPSDNPDETDPLHSEDSMKFYRGETGMNIGSSIPGDEFDAYTEELEKEGAELASYNDEEHIKDFEDKAIKDALMSGDEERFERIITRGGSRHAAISSTLLTQYDSRGRIIQIDPSDENLILHGTKSTTRG
ncbi:MAG: hypothetical protein J6I66_10305 [Lachnospiraceae bacterium]|nr:hypothetical protein [Lachnospiraceae bacterium]